MIKGHSGCIITVDGNVLSKKASSDNYDPMRLYKQIQKQKKAAKSKYNRIHIPDIIKEDYVVYMKYVSSIDILKYIEDNAVKDIDWILNILIDIIKTNLKECKTQHIPFDIIDDKFETILKHVSPNKYYVLLQHKYFELTKSEIELPVGVCHGDLTLSNVLIDTTENNLVLLDFLDSFIESPLIDMAKLRQDTKHKWLLFLTSVADEGKIKICLNYMDNYLHNAFRRYDFYNKYYSLFQFMNLARIIPYAKNQETVDFIMKEIECIH